MCSEDSKNKELSVKSNKKVHTPAPNKMEDKNENNFFEIVSLDSNFIFLSENLCHLNFCLFGILNCLICLSTIDNLISYALLCNLTLYIYQIIFLSNKNL